MNPVSLVRDLSPEFLAAIGLGAIVFIVAATLIVNKLLKHKKPHKFRQQWRDIQKKLPDHAKWGEAVVEADNLLKDALSKKKIKGKTTGERLVKAEKIFSDNDEVWFGHKLRKKIDAKPNAKLDKKEVSRALVGLRQGIKDLGAFDGKR
ncbi:hypothetical protein KY385_04165 [Candidatus Parcubacteria bacterium]|nr:hypothetical protein [Candidatus Parcubacteria bacterium]